MLGGFLLSLTQLLMNTGYPSLPGQLCAHLTPQTTGTPCWGHHGDIVTSSHPWLGLIPVFFPFSSHQRPLGGFQALELCSAKVLLRAGDVPVLNECSKVSVGSWAG